MQIRPDVPSSQKIYEEGRSGYEGSLLIVFFRFEMVKVKEPGASQRLFVFAVMKRMPLILGDAEKESTYSRFHRN